MYKNIVKRLGNNFIFVSSIISVLILAISAIIAYLHFTEISGTNIIIYLNQYQNKVLFAEVSDLYRFITLGLVLIILNFFIAIELRTKDLYLAKIVTITSIALAVLILISTNAIIKLN